MEWTHKNPTEIGFYWVFIAYKKQLAMMEIKQGVTGLSMRSHCSTGAGMPLPSAPPEGYMSTYWMGPIPVPDLPEIKIPEYHPHGGCFDQDSLPSDGERVGAIMVNEE